MVTRAPDDELFDEFSSDRFQKMPRRYDWWMPSRKARPVQSASVRTPGASTAVAGAQGTERATSQN
jgi:hypothetical protein